MFSYVDPRINLGFQSRPKGATVQTLMDLTIVYGHMFFSLGCFYLLFYATEQKEKVILNIWALHDIELGGYYSGRNPIVYCLCKFWLT